jgi:uncharacterized protein
METVIQPRVKIVYSGKDITRDITPYLLSVEYTDNTTENSDEASFTVEDTEGLWRTEWMPSKGDKIDVEIGYDNEMLKCGTFTVDEIEFSGPPDTVQIRALAASVGSPVRTKNSKAYEQQTLRQIANEIANKYGYEVIDNNADKNALDDIKIQRITQNRETDLAFLKRVSDDYGIMFSLRDTKLIFTSIFDIEKGESILTLERGDLLSYSVKDTATSVYKEATVKHTAPKQNKVIESKVPTKFMYGGEGKGPDTKSEDVLEIRVKADDPKQAEKKARAKLHKANSKEKEGSFTIIGNTKLIAGNNFTLVGMGGFSGKWNITKSSHKVDRGGYITDFEAKLIEAGKGIGKQAIVGEVLFDFDQAVLRPAGIAEVDRVIQFMNENPNAIMEIGGHTDSDGSAQYNTDLSDRRANAVRDYMIGKGVFATRLKAKGYGEGKPVASNATAEGRQRNRRTEFVVIQNN